MNRSLSKFFIIASSFITLSFFVAHAQTFSALPTADNTTPCSSISGFASSCATPSNPSTSITSFSNESATMSQVSFTVTATAPTNNSSNSFIVWNTGYYWSRASNEWIPFRLSGIIYSGIACSPSSSGCWLEGSGSAQISVPPGAATEDGSLFILTYDEQLVNSSWQAPACVKTFASCWRISVYPPTSIGALTEYVQNNESVQDISTFAENAGYIVQTDSSTGVPYTTIEQPFTHDLIASILGPED